MVDNDDLDAWMTAARNEDDRHAFSLVVEACQRLIRLRLLRDTADPDLADEIAQEALVRAWTKRHLYRPGTSPRAWLLAIARSQMLEHHRHQDRKRRHLKGLVRQELLRHQHNNEPDELHQERLLALNTCLNDMNESQRELLDMVHGQGLSTDDAADILGIKPATCRQRLSRLQRSLKSGIEELLHKEGLA